MELKKKTLEGKQPKWNWPKQACHFQLYSRRFRLYRLDYQSEYVSQIKYPWLDHSRRLSKKINFKYFRKFKRIWWSTAYKSEKKAPQVHNRNNYLVHFPIKSLAAKRFAQLPTVVDSILLRRQILQIVSVFVSCGYAEHLCYWWKANQFSEKPVHSWKKNFYKRNFNKNSVNKKFELISPFR